MVLPGLCNLMCNFFRATLVINKRRGIDEIPFIASVMADKPSLRCADIIGDRQASLIGGTPADG
jgi:hypothetical protein